MKNRNHKTKNSGKKSILFISVLIVLISFVFSSAADYVVVGYYPSYRHDRLPAEDLQLEHLTHIMHSFVYPDEAGNIFHSDNFIYPELVQRIHDENKKIFVALGGGAQSGAFSAMAADSASRANFVNNIVNFCSQHGYDGIDIDWEHPGSAKDKLSMNKLVYDLKQKNPDLEITGTIPGSNWVGQYMDYDYLTPFVEWFGCMAYDMRGPWSATSGHHAPLFAPGTQGSVEQNTNYLNVTRNIPSEKIVMGIPFYGHLFNSTSLGASNSGGSSLGYIDVMLNINNGWTFNWDDFAKVPFLVNSAHTQIISYDNVQSVSLKCDFAKQRKLGGVMIWEISHDQRAGDQPLLERAGLKMLELKGHLTSTVNITSPAYHAVFEKGSEVEINASASDSVGSISKVEFFIDTVKAGQADSPPYSITWQADSSGLHIIKAVAFNNLGVATPSERVYIHVQNETQEQTPFYGTALTVPGIIEAEDFDNGGEGAAYHDSSPGNTGGSYRTDVDVDIESCAEGGFNIGYITDGEWFEYTINADSTGFYDIDFRVAAMSDEGAFHMEVDSQDVTTSIVSPVTNGWQAWVTVTAPDIELAAGEHVIRFYVNKAGFNIHNIIFRYTGTTAIENNPMISRAYELHQNYPNPFNPSTTISYSIPKAEFVEIGVYNIQGQKIKTLIAEQKQAGHYSLKFDAKGISSGVYFCRIKAGSFVDVRKMILLQ